MSVGSGAGSELPTVLGWSGSLVVDSRARRAEPAQLRLLDSTGRPAPRDQPDTLLGGPLAHPVEQGTFNPKVARSRLARPTSTEALFALGESSR